MSGTYKCPYCGQALTRKRGAVIRYKPVKNRQNITLGEYRYLPKYCKTCRLSQYFREARLYHLGAKWRDCRLIGERAYNQAFPYSVAMQTVRTTAGEFTRRIAQAADSYYGQRYLGKSRS
ncbi:MAG: hypothetical protein KTR14_01940 [Vampirovibrio sp.]|nr:hypothetical protein [Vampirovibrio sp.]